MTATVTPPPKDDVHTHTATTHMVDHVYMYNRSISIRILAKQITFVI